MKITLAGEVAARDKPRKGGTLLCAKKPPRKKKGKKATSEAGYPLYSTSGADGKVLKVVINFRSKNFIDVIFRLLNLHNLELKIVSKKFCFQTVPSQNVLSHKVSECRFRRMSL